MNLWAPTCRLTIGDVDYAAGGEFGPRVQRSLQLVWIESGEVTVWIDGIPTRVRSGECILLMPLHRERFRFARHAPTHHGWCEVIEPVLDPRAEVQIAGVAGQPRPTPPEIAPLSSAALSLRSDVRWSARTEFDMLCSAILFAYFRSTGVPDPRLSHAAGSPDIPPAVGRALDAVHRDFATLDGAGDIAARAGVSQQHLGRLFSRRLGTSPAAYLWQTRTARAIDLIRATGLPLFQIATQTGFRTQFHLSRRVHEALGVSPSELREPSRSGALATPETPN